MKRIKCSVFDFLFSFVAYDQMVCLYEFVDYKRNEIIKGLRHEMIDCLDNLDLAERFVEFCYSEVDEMGCNVIFIKLYS